MNEIITWIQAHQAELLAAAGAAYALVSIIVRLTPSTADDEFMRKLAERVSFLQPQNGDGVFSLPGKRAKHVDPLESRR